MSATAALRAARAAGVAVGVDGDDLMLQASAPPPPAVLDALSRHRPAIIALLQPARDGWPIEDWHVLFDELASMAERKGGLPRAKAEARAFACCVAEWLNRNPARSAPGRCLGCGHGDRPGDPLLPFGTEISGHAWLHAVCWPARYRPRWRPAPPPGPAPGRGPRPGARSGRR